MKRGYVAGLDVTWILGAGVLGRYWIRNRGRVQGPLTVDRIQGLLRRGRFSRHFHVSDNKKDWFPAQDFPELFAGVGRGGDTDDDDEVFHGGGSPFDDDDDEDMAPTRAGRGGGSSGSRKRRRPVDEDEDDDEEDDDDDRDDEDDDDDWDDDDHDGVLSGALDWIEDHSKVMAGVLIVLLLGLGWFVFGRETFAQDTEDLELLLNVKSKISTTHALGTDAATWQQLADSTIADLKPLVARLNETASSADHVKQELLFASRDEIPKMFIQLPRGDTEAEQRIVLRFNRIDRMIKAGVRFDSTSVLNLPPKAAPVTQPQTVAPADPSEADPSETDPSETDPSAPMQAEANESKPPTDMSPTDAAPPMQPTPPNDSSSPGQPNNTSGGIPGRPAPAKF